MSSSGSTSDRDTASANVRQLGRTFHHRPAESQPPQRALEANTLEVQDSLLQHKHFRRKHGPQVDIRVALLTGAQDRSYALGLASSLLAQGISIDFIGSDTVNCPELHDRSGLRFLNLRGDQRENVSLATKILRIGAYYARVIKYAVVAEPRIFHILWNNKFEIFDRTILTIYYKLVRRKIVLTVHNVNAAKRDGQDSFVNRLSLAFQYRMADHIFVHTDQMNRQICTQFKVDADKIKTVPFGINDTLPLTNVTRHEARRYLGLASGEMALLFFGQIAPYKGLEYLIRSAPKLIESNVCFRILIAGKIKRGHDDYWSNIASLIRDANIGNRIFIRAAHIPDEEVEIFFKASDVLVLPYTDIYQSGLPFLAYSFGLPVIATDVGSLREDIVEGRTGYVCKPRDPADLANAIKSYFRSNMYSNLASIRPDIQRFAHERYSWTKVATITASVYRALLER